MILVDTSIWIDFLNRGDSDLMTLLDTDSVVMHRYVIGEIALGSLKNRREQLAFLNNLQPVPVASHAEVMALVEWGKLHGTGVGYVDAHLLAAARAVDDVALWTRDKRLHAQAERLGIAASI